MLLQDVFFHLTRGVFSVILCQVEDLNTLVVLLTALEKYGPVLCSLPLLLFKSLKLPLSV